MNRTGLRLAAIAACTLLGCAADAQLSSLTVPAAGPSGAPVSFTADQITYDKTGNIVTAAGHVRAFQNGQTLYADKIVIDRNTDVVTATGHVILVQPTGETVFANQAVLSKGMKDAVLRGISARLAMNARMIANGGRRYNGEIDQLAKAVYSACDLCKTDPQAPPLWQIRAPRVTRDYQHKMIEFRDAEMQFDGFPIFYMPYLTEPDPSVRRQTGLLIPSAGVSSHIGYFVTIPYFVVLSQESDVTFTPIFAEKQGPALKADYRRAFNNGILNIDISGGRDRGINGGESFGNSVFANGTFDLNQDWRAGFNYDHASNPNYLNDFNILPLAAYLTSNVYVEGFSPGAYARLDAETFQGLVASVDQSELPIVAPYGQYHFISGQDGIGGQFSLDASAFNVLRKLGTNTQRIAAIPGYSVPFMLPDGIAGQARAELVAAAYSASHLYDQPNYSTLDSADAGRVQPYGAVFLRWPFIRSAGTLGSQVIEPEVQFVASPEVGISQNYRIPNEDSLDLEFSDANLFSFNRYPGIDRLEGGSRVDYALHAAWYLPRGAFIDGLVGQSYRFHTDHDYLPDSGLNDNISDIVGRIVVAPTPLFNLTYRTRLSHDDLGARMIDATANFGNHRLNFSGGYLYTNTDPYVLYDSTVPYPTLDPPAGYFTARRELTANAATNFGPWSFSAGTGRNLLTGKFDSASFSAGWQNDCFGASILYYERFTSFNLDDGSTTVLVQFTFKTLGNVGFSAL